MAWVYIQSTFPGEYLWTVGFYDPQGQWQPEGDFDTKEAAANRCHFLNGGSEQGAHESVAEPLRSIVNGIARGAFR
jgi:hypothetical protein